MRRMILPLTLCVFAACQPTTMELTDEQKAEIEAAVRQAATEYNELWTSDGDIDRYMSYNSDWAGAPWECCGTLDDLRSYVTSYWSRWDWESKEVRDMRVMVLGPDAAAVTFTTGSVRVDTAGVRLELTGEQAYLMVRETGQWKLLMGKSKSYVQ